MTTHPSSIRTRWAAIGAAVAVTIGAAGIGGYNIVSADVSTGDRPVFVPINPCRLVDTRPGNPNVGPKSTPLGPDETITVTAHGDNGECTGVSTIPTDAVGLSLNVTAVGQTERTFLTIWGEGDDPGTSNLNPEPGQPPTPNAVNTPLSATGTFNVRNNAGSVNALIDVVGYYAHHNHDDRYYTETESDDRYYTETEADERFVSAGRHDSAYTLAARIDSDGSVDRVQGLPDGAMLDIERQSTGRYRVTVNGLGELGIEFAQPIIMVTAIGPEDDCRHTGGGGLSGGSNALGSFSTSVACTDADDISRDSSFNIAVFLEHG